MASPAHYRSDSVWNRVLTYQTTRFSENQVEEDLGHAARWEVRDKIYVLAACLAYLVRRIDAGTNWHLDFRNHILRFPASPGLSPESDMGFPKGWSELPLWRTLPAKAAKATP